LKGAVGPETHLDASKTDSESDCGYMGGVNCDLSDDEPFLDTEPGSDEESLAELEGDELEDNL
jgi:hypothetical protein